MQTVVRRWIPFFLLLVLLGIASAATRPNILFILADDLGWGDLSCYGNTRFKTPQLDRLAREGTLFTQYYQGGSVCSPSRCSILTGRWPAEFRIHGHYATAELNRQRDMSNFLDPKAPNLPALLNRSGYHTIHVGKWHLGSPPKTDGSLRVYGFDESKWIDARQDGTNLWDVAQRPHATARLVDATIDALRRAGTNAFYCQLWLNDPHALLAPSQEQMQPFLKNKPPFIPPIAVYGGTVLEMDRQLGRLFQALDQLNLATNTLVIFTSDNGPEDIEIGNATWSGVGSAGPLRGRKRSLYEGGVRVPLLVRWPGTLPAGKVNQDTVISGVDWLPTLCDLAGAEIPSSARPELRGEVIAPALKGDTSFHRTRPLMWEWRFRVFNHPWNRSPVLAIREGDFKLLLNPDRSRLELYEIPADPSEQNNLAGLKPDLVRSLSEKAWAWQSTLPPGRYEPSAGKNDYPWPNTAR